MNKCLIATSFLVTMLTGWFLAIGIQFCASLGCYAVFQANFFPIWAFSIEVRAYRHFADIKILRLIYFSLFHSHLQYCIIDWGRAYETVIRPVQVLQNRIVKYMTFSNRTLSASNIFKLLKILKVSDLYQLNLEKFMYKYNADILLSSFDNFFSKLYNIYDHGTRQQVSGNFHHKRVRSDYGKKMLQYVGPVA